MKITGVLIHETDSPEKRVLIIGGSMAGLHTALELLKLGFKPTIYERRPNPKTGIVCAEGIALWALRRSGLVLPKGTVASETMRIRIHAPDDHFWQGNWGNAMGYTLWRDKLEDDLARKIRKLGGKIHYNRKVGTQEFMKLAGGYEFIVGADGITGVTRKVLNLPMPHPEDIHIGVQQLCSLNPLEHPMDRIDLYFGKSVAPKGYGWILPVGRGKARVGLGIALSEKANPKELLDMFNKRIGAIPLEPLKAKLVPTTRPLMNPAFGNVLLVGDAGNFCNPFTGAGIANAVISAKAAAKAIAEENPERYKKYVGWLISQNRVRYRLKQVLLELSDQELNELIWGLEGFQVSTLGVDLNILRALLALALHKPRLLARHKVLRRMLGLSKG